MRLARTLFLLFLTLAVLPNADRDHCLAQQPSDRGLPSDALDPEASFRKFHVAEGYQWEQVLSEPLIRQPLMISFDDQERLWLVEYRQYPEPAGLKPQSRDVHWRIVYDRIPDPPGRGGIPGIDRISVHEDLDKDGHFEKHHVFLDNLNIATAVAPVPGGAWVLNPPYLTFYADRDGDLRADGFPEIHLVGFGLEDTHSVVNSLTLGPDGWLYAAQGSTVTGNVRSYGTEDKATKSLGQAIWRYHPITRKYEIFAEGGGNAFGVALDDHGDVFSGHNGGDTRGFHYVQGGYYRKGFTKHGSLSNPFSFGYLMPMKHEPIQRFTHTMFLEDSFWRGTQSPRMIAVDPLHGKLIHTRLDRNGSTYDTVDIGELVSSDDKWFRPVAITQGPDGSAYVCDWYDFQVAHIYAHVGQLDKERGRVYRLIPGEGRQKSILSAYPSLTSALQQLESPIRWQRDRARRMIAASASKDSIRGELLDRLRSTSQQNAVEYLWTIHACGWMPGTIPGSLTGESAAMLQETDLLSWFDHSHPDVRSWLIRLLCDDGQIDGLLLSRMCTLAREESDPRVLCQIASSAKRLSADAGTLVLASLCANSIDGSDLFLPSLIWWALEQHCDAHALILERLVSNSELLARPWVTKFLFPKMVERWARENKLGTFDALTSLFEAIASIQDETARSESAKGSVEAFENAFQNRSLKSVPAIVIQKLVGLGVPSLPLAIRREEPEALEKAIQLVRQSSTKKEQRAGLIRLAGEMRLQAFLSVLLEEIRKDKNDELVLQACMFALASFDNPEIAKTVIDVWPRLSESTRSVAGATLAKRSNWVSAWIEACKSGRVETNSLPLDSQRAMRWIEDERVQEELGKLYPAVSGFTLAAADEAAEKIARFVDDHEGDPYRGKAIYRIHCGRCHRLFDDGGNIGPDLTGYQRDQLKTLLRNIVAPSLEIREGYTTESLVTEDGTTLVGFVESEAQDQLVVKGIDGQSQTIAKSDIVARKPQALSIMPERILDGISPSQVSDLLAYLRSTQPIMDK
jgi:putative heme-binding domain-containing protein